MPKSDPGLAKYAFLAILAISSMSGIAIGKPRIAVRAPWFFSPRDRLLVMVNKMENDTLEQTIVSRNNCVFSTGDPNQIRNIIHKRILINMPYTTA